MPILNDTAGRETRRKRGAWLWAIPLTLLLLPAAFLIVLWLVPVELQIGSMIISLHAEQSVGNSEYPQGFGDVYFPPYSRRNAYPHPRPTFVGNMTRHGHVYDLPDGQHSGYLHLGSVFFWCIWERRGRMLR
jgi:hypothetical protein